MTRPKSRDSRRTAPSVLQGVLAVLVAVVPATVYGEEVGAPVDFTTDRGAAAKVALLVGIADYPSDVNREWPDLQGCVNDTARVRRLLIDAFGFHTDDIKVLNDEQATHENIVRGFREWLIERSGPATEALFWFSGHGSRTPDASGLADAELDGLDSTFLAWDSRSDGRDGEYDLTDDELHSLVRALTDRTGRVTVITDSCFSGGTMRGTSTLPVRTARPGSRGRTEALAFWPADVPYLEDGAQQAADPTRYVHISACSSREPAVEWTMATEAGGESYGALTFFLTYAMEGATSTDTYRTLTEKARTWMGYRGLTQSVMCDGATDRVLFHGAFAARPPGFAVLSWDAPRIARVQAGSLIGVHKGAEFRLIGLDGADHGGAIASRVDSSECRVQLDASAPDWLRDVPLRAMLTALPGERPPLRISVWDDAVADRLLADHAVEIDRQVPPRAVHTLVLAREGADARAVFYAPDGLRIWRSEVLPAEPRDVLTAVSTQFGVVLDTELKYREVNALLAHAGDLALTGRFRAPTEEELSGPGGGRRWATRAVSPAIRLAHPLNDGVSEGSYVAELDPEQRDAMSLAVLEVRNPNDVPVFVHVLSVAEDRAIHLVEPAGHKPPKRIEAGSTGSVYVALEVNDKLGLSRAMRDRYLMVATSTPADFSSLTQGSVLRSGSVIPPMLARAFGSNLTRGATVPVDGSGFGVSAVDLYVRDREGR